MLQRGMRFGRLPFGQFGLTGASARRLRAISIEAHSPKPHGASRGSRSFNCSVALPFANAYTLQRGMRFGRLPFGQFGSTGASAHRLRVISSGGVQ